MFPLRSDYGWWEQGLPHRRGDVSAHSFDERWGKTSSPQAWGCFPFPNDWDCKWVVFPTGVGMFLMHREVVARGHSLPHRRGDVSTPRQRIKQALQSSPQAWGCFRVCC